MLADEKVWARCLDRCVTLQRISPAEFAIKLAVETGPLKGEIESNGRLTIVTPVNKVELAGSARGAAIGSLEWHAVTTVAGESGCSTLTYSLTAEANGGTNGVGPAIMEKMGRASIERFLGALSHEFLASDGHARAEPSEAGATLQAGPVKRPELAAFTRPRHFRGLRLLAWIAVLILVGLRLLSFFQS